MKYAIERRDGGVSVMVLHADTTVAAELAKFTPDNPEYEPVAVHPLDPKHDLTDRTFRNAWTHRGGGEIHVPIEKARDLTKMRLRMERGPILAELDAYYMKALESGDTNLAARVAARKQALRDLPVTVDKVESLDALKAMKAEDTLDAPLVLPAEVKT